MGRPSKVQPPPRAWQASGTVPDLLQAQHLADLPRSEQRPYLAGADLAAAAAELNEAFEWYALWAAGQHNRAPHGEVRDWFGQVAGQATDLLHALGHDRPALCDRGFKDVITHLMDARPHPGSATGGPDRERDAQHDLERLTRLAAPDAFAAAERDHSPNPAWEAAQEIINTRLKATMELLHLLASRGAERRGALVTQGGRDPEEARKHLFVNLARQYEHLFGKLPGAPSPTPTKTERAAGERRQSLPKGPALDWFSALLALVGTQAEQALPSCQLGGAAPDPDREKLLRELLDLSATARKGKAQDGLAHWIREAASACVKPRPPTELDPDFAPTPLGKTFG